MVKFGSLLLESVIALTVVTSTTVLPYEKHFRVQARGHSRIFQNWRRRSFSLFCFFLFLYMFLTFLSSSPLFQQFSYPPLLIYAYSDWISAAPMYFICSLYKNSTLGWFYPNTRRVYHTSVSCFQITGTGTRVKLHQSFRGVLEPTTDLIHMQITFKRFDNCHFSEDWRSWIVLIKREEG